MPRFSFQRATLVLALFVGLLAGLGCFTFVYGEGFSYFSTDPKACANCHIMNDEYATWAKSGHHHVAGCIDCHLPHETLPKLLAKGRNGWNHSLAFTLENFHEPILISQKNREILQENCVRCHDPLVHDAILVPAGGSVQAQSCVHCHRHVGHAPIH